MSDLRVVFLAGADTSSTRQTIEAVCRLSHIQPVGVLVDTYRPPLRVRWKNLRRNVRREGVAYLHRRALGALSAWLDGRAARAIPKTEIESLLRQAFPERNYSLEDLAARYSFPVIEAGNLNDPAAARKLGELGADLGVVVGTRVLKRSTFAVPRMGSINLHKGAVPAYRGMPPGFWELYDGAKTAGVTIHFVDDGLDTGDVIGTAEIPIHPLETLASLRTKLDMEGARLLAESVASLQAGTAERRPQPSAGGKTRTKPTWREQQDLARRAPHLRPTGSDAKNIAKTALYLFLWRGGIFHLKRRLRRAPGGRGAIILYHRVNDISDDNLTVSTRAFAEHLLLLKRYYRVVSTGSLVESVLQRRAIPPGSVAIHFDDCYRDVFLEGSRLLKAAQMPAAMFIATGFIDTDRVFEHDRTKYPHRFENLRRQEIPALVASGFQIGAHTVNHVDLGSIDADAARREVTESRWTLEEITGGSVPLFSFPFGRERNIREEARTAIREAGFEALFSAHGGFVSGKSDPFDIPRFGANSRYRALDLMMELEGLSLPQLFPGLRRLVSAGTS